MFRNLKIDVICQTVIADLYSVDFLLFNKVIINFNGPQHYMKNNLLKLNIKSKLKTEILEKNGYFVVDVNFLHTQGEEQNPKNLIRIIDNELKKQLPGDNYIKYNLDSYLKKNN